MIGRWKRYFVPGFVIRTVLIGATYATGREVTEFFLRYGPFSAFVGLIITTTIYSLFCILTFELARRFKVLDYKSFCEIYMGRWWFLYEFGFIFGVILTLATIGAAAGEFAHDSFGAPRLAGSLALMALIGALVYLGTDRLERLMSWWSIAFYSLYAIVVVIALYHLWGELRTRLVFEPVSLDAVIAAVTYALFNCAILPVVIFVARHLESRSDSVIAGALAGPLLMLPGLALLLILIPFFPKVVEAPLPITLVLQRLGIASLADVVKIAIVVELAFNGSALLHGVNERIATSMKEKQKVMPSYLRSIIALGALIFSAYIADRIGLITLVSAGFRSGAYAFLAIMLLPLLTRGFWMVFPRRAAR